MTLRLHTASLLAATALLMLCGCGKSDPAYSDEGLGQQVCISVALDAGTKAALDGDGSGIYADRCRLQILADGELCYDNTVKVNAGRATYNDVYLELDHTYDYLFWADNEAGSYYNTDDLRKVTLNGSYDSFDDARDAFYGAAIGVDVEVMCDTTLVLKRPFAQLNVITCDIPGLYDQISDKSQFGGYLPSIVRISLSEVPTCFDVSTGLASGSQPAESYAAVYTSDWKLREGDRNTLSMNYFFASPGEDAFLTEVDFGCYNSASGLVNAEYHWTNIPVRQNWRSNIIGDLVTNTGDVRVVINNNWNE